MIDSLFRLLPMARRTGAVARLGLRRGEYALVTLHRPAVVENSQRFASVLEVLGRLGERLPVVMPLHPRTRSRLEDHHWPPPKWLRIGDPLEYLGFLDVEASARLVITDSGGVQEETSALGVPCVTYRTTTERPVTITHGTNRLAGLDPVRLERACEEILAAPGPRPAAELPHWDGHAGPRAAHAIVEAMRDWAKADGGVRRSRNR